MAHRKSPVTDRQIIKLYKELGSGNATADQLGIARPTVYAVLTKHNVQLIWRRRRRNASDKEILLAYKQLKSGDRVAKELHVSSDYVYKVLARAGIDSGAYWKGLRRFKGKSVDHLKELYKQGASLTQLARRFRCSVSAIKRTLEEDAHVKLRRKKHLTPEEQQRAVEMYKAGKSLIDITRHFGLTDSQQFPRFMHRYHKELLRPKARVGVWNHNWKGGRHIHRGIVYIRLAADDQFSVMRDSSGYVMEHRLIVARKLGRPLRPTESVHHINGDPLDNRPENLQLRQGKHGHHVVMRCLDCGSVNVEPVRLSDEDIRLMVAIPSSSMIPLGC